jgi:hypothetical protein
MHHKVGDYVEYAIDPDAVAIGIIGSLEGNEAYVVEVKAFHRYWGGSNACRGQVTRVELSDIEPLRAPWRYIIDRVKDKAKVRNVLDELLMPARP